MGNFKHIYFVVVFVFGSTVCSLACTETGQTCYTENQCCFGLNCLNGICVRGYCIKEGYLCRPGDVCCRPTVCMNDICSKPCVRGGVCFEDGNCCVGSHCQEGICVTDCSPKNETCQIGELDCCSGSCKEGTCVAEGQKYIGDQCNPLTDPCTGSFCTNRTCQNCQFLGKPCKVKQDCCGYVQCIDGTCKCRNLGEKCRGDHECCKTSEYDIAPRYCVHGICRVVCLPIGVECLFNEVCCSSFCKEGKCSKPCILEGFICKENSDCCKGICGERSLCQSSGKCAKIDEGCTTNDDCCLSKCVNGTCKEPCVQKNNQCDNRRRCCDGGYCVHKRCRDKPCLEKGVACKENYECCSSLCVNGFCSDKCLPQGSKCTRNDQCCNKYCNEGQCSTTCKYDYRCDANHECCDGLCIAGQCYYECNIHGGKCKTPRDCCFTNFCDNGKCFRDCSSKGMTCLRNANCCSSICINGTCREYN